MLDSVIRVGKKNYPQGLLEECIYETKKTKIENLMNDGLDPSLSDNELIVILIMILIMNLTMMILMNNLLKVKTVF